MSETQRQIEGPARLHAVNDEFGLNHTHAGQSAEAHLTAVYGEKGVGWDFEMGPAKTPQERLDRRMGRLVGNVTVTPDGDHHAEIIEVRHS